MKITTSTNLKAYQATLRNKEELKKASTKTNENNTDVVSMSKQAKDANFASHVGKTISNELNSVYASRIDALKQSIKNGEYRVDDEKLADAIIQHTWEA